MNIISEKRLNEISTAIEKATGKPWERWGYIGTPGPLLDIRHPIPVVSLPGKSPDYDAVCRCVRGEDSAFIVLARTAMPEMLKALDEAYLEIRTLRNTVLDYESRLPSSMLSKTMETTK